MLHQSQFVRNFIKEACGKVKSRRAQTLLAHELTAHIEDQKAAYMREGMDEDSAELIAVEQMGDPAGLSEQFRQVHRANLEWVPTAVMWTAAGIIMLAGLAAGVILGFAFYYSAGILIGFFAGAGMIIFGAIFGFMFVTIWKQAEDMILSYVLLRDYRRRREQTKNKF